MTSISIRDQIKKLVDLQKFDKEIYDLNQDKAQKPKAIAALKQEFEAKKANVKELEEKLKRVQLERNQKELELKEKETAIEKTNAQLSLLKTNREYTAKLTEIESLKADKSIFEEKILESYDQADAVKKELDEENKKVAGEEKGFLERKKVLEDDIKEIDDRLQVLESQRTRLLPDIDKENLRRYERILNHKEGIAIVPIVNNSCGGCHMNITQQMINQMKMHAELINCEMCARILYLEDDL